MKKKSILILLAFLFVIEAIITVFLFKRIKDINQDVVKINECVKAIEDNYDNTEKYSKNLDYSIINNKGELIYKTNMSNSDSINHAIKNNDIILDLEVNGEKVGKILIKNSTNELINQYKNYIFITVFTAMIIQIALLSLYFYYINMTIIKPFENLNKFAVRVAEGNLDMPLYMDKKHIFGEFTEAFDLMRSELKKARVNEKKANDDKKEMVAKLSHDIKTPIASIKATSEIGYEKAKDDELKNYFNQINIKVDQVKVLVDNLFNSSVNEIKKINVNPSNYPSNILTSLIRNSDYLNKLNNFDIPACNIYIDKMRMQQILDNIINNSYKYANTKIDIDIKQTTEYLIVNFRDYGKGVNELDLPLLKEKYKRGRDVKDKDGAGLGLYLANYFIDNMNGKLELKNSNPGLIVTIYIRII